MQADFAPCRHPRASGLVQSFWATVGTPAHSCEVILPKGVVELIFSFEDALPFTHVGKREQGHTPRCFINGLNVAGVRLHAPRLQSFFGVVLHPAAVKPLLKAPSGTFLNAIVDLELIDPAFGALWHRLADAPDFRSKVSIAENWVSRHQANFHQQEFAISGFLHSGDEVTSVAALASHFCYSSRQLSRKAHELFGMSTEALIGYRRYLQALEFVHNTDTPLTDIAHRCNFYDQAHFIREFKEYTGLTPGEYRRQRSRLTAHLFQ